MSTHPLDILDLLKVHAVLEKENLPPPFWQTIGLRKKEPTSAFIKSLLSTHNVETPSEALVDTLHTYATLVHCLKQEEEPKKTKPAESEPKSPKTFELNHVYKMVSAKAIQNSSEIASSSEAEMTDDSEDLEECLFYVYRICENCETPTAQVHWFYTRNQIREDLADSALREPRKGAERLRYVRMEDDSSILALSNHSQQLEIDNCHELVDVTDLVAWSQQETGERKDIEYVITHFQRVSPNVEPIKPIESSDVFNNRRSVNQVHETLSKLLLGFSGNAANAVTAFKHAIESDLYSPIYNRRSYIACIFTQNDKKRGRMSDNKPRYALRGGQASPWANAVIKLLRYAARNVPWTSKEAVDELVMWADALAANPKSSLVKNGNLELANLDTGDFDQKLFKHFLF